MSEMKRLLNDYCDLRIEYQSVEEYVINSDGDCMSDRLATITDDIADVESAILAYDTPLTRAAPKLIAEITSRRTANNV